MTDHEQDLRALLDLVPGWRGRARLIRALTGGMTNRNYLIGVDLPGHTPSGGTRSASSGEEHFVARVTSPLSRFLEIDRTREFDALQRAAEHGIAPQICAFIEAEGFLVTRFINGTSVDARSLARPPRLNDAVNMLRALHSMAPLCGDFNAWTVPRRHASSAQQHGVQLPASFEIASVIAAEIEASFATTPEPFVPCHNDLLSANFLLEDGTDRMWLIDWEYAGNNDRYFDLANLAVNNDLDDSSRHTLIELYFGSVTRRRLARLELMAIMSDFREAMWAVVQQGISTIDFDYTSYADKHFDRLIEHASRANYRADLAAAAQQED